MKRIFPIITILITLSLLGLIFFQVLWLQKVRDIKNETLKDNVVKATGEAGLQLMEDNSFIPRKKRPDILFPNDKFGFEFKRPSVIGRYSKEDIKIIIESAFKNYDLAGIPFEYAITQNSITGDQVQTENFFKYYIDTATNMHYVFPLQGASGSSLENLSTEELLVVLVPNQKSIILKEMSWFIIGAILFTLIIVAAFFITIRTLLKQKKLSEIKSDFINNMTHEFKTPLATISLAVDALKNEKVVADKEKTRYFTGVIKEENLRMNKQVETILQAALLDKQEVQLNLAVHSAHELITKALNNIALPVNERGGDLQIHLDAGKQTILADEVHFINFVNNLLDNALKYSKEHPIIKLSTANVGNNIKIKIEDNGIGMAKDSLSRIFEKFYRVHTGNIHNVKGFGLGLSYVKKMVQAHKGSIKAESALGKGSCFIITIPIINSPENVIHTKTA